MTPEWLTRDGHLTALSLERHLAGEIDATSHLDSCTECKTRWIALQADAALPVPAPPVEALAASRWPLVGIALAAAAALAVFVLRPPPEGDGVRVKGSFAFEVHAHDGQSSRLLVDGDTVAPGERLGFRVKSAAAGHLLIFGQDATPTMWLAYPQGGQGKSAPFEGGALRDLNEAVTLDATPGEERLTALLCEAPITGMVAAPILTRGDVPDGCRIRRIRLRKSGATP